MNLKEMTHFKKNKYSVNSLKFYAMCFDHLQRWFVFLPTWDCNPTSLSKENTFLLKEIFMIIVSSSVGPIYSWVSGHPLVHFQPSRRHVLNKIDFPSGRSYQVSMRTISVRHRCLWITSYSFLACWLARPCPNFEQPQ